MTNTVIVKGNKTLGEGDDGTIQCVEVSGTIKLPNESDWKFKKGDEFTVVSDAEGNVSIVGENGVTLVPRGITLSAKGTAANIKYEGNNTYLIWTCICIALIGGISMLYSYKPNIAEEIMILINWIE